MLASFVLALTLAAASAHASVAGDADSSDNVINMIKSRNRLTTHNLHQPYIDSDLQNRWWDFGGDAIVNTNKHVRLTQDRKSERGYIWSRMAIPTDVAIIEFEFKVDGKGMSTYGDGFAMWLTSDRGKPGPVFGNEDFFNGLGIFFDTYANSRHGYTFPRITAMLGDGKTKYDQEGDNAAHELAGCSRNFRRKNIPTRARLTYVRDKGVALETQFEDSDKWDLCFSVPNLKLPRPLYVGFSAHTGDVADNHDIISVSASTGTLYPQYENNGDDGQKPLLGGKGATQYGRAPPSKSSGSGWFLWILKVIGIVAFLAFAFAAYRTYSAQQTKRPQYF